MKKNIQIIAFLLLAIYLQGVHNKAFKAYYSKKTKIEITVGYINQL